LSKLRTTKTAPRTQSLTGGAGAVYAAVSSLVAAVPLPILDRWLVSLVRGAAMRRVAERHGVRLTPKARTVLSSTSAAKETGSRARRLVRTAVERALSPVRVVGRIEDAIGTVVAAALFDHYLETYHREGPIAEAEAKRIRAAIESAEIRGLFLALRSAPGAAADLVTTSVRTIIDADDDRTPAERLADALLEGLSRAPDGFLGRARQAFDRALEDGE
jgi:uncharacterized protein (DUF697 family)